mmetsp:Transcript_61122/g.137739  ORF Transcript_61122/g.137739 Transcript_61122/m.137739 type:complete len:647 (-) Transcript_61122:93-2033(-)|eukprot:CAMPEP_0197884306 /NCGR_PEP_ID=MMETSP1439-20131203/10801_1 /TAXON_ID=66791 /ORGANISM="Gonyaulax spinifera, Strain CCMP409" /LENGTH=646 /DNA_ID=CAMNT_0043504035 /DNA_START=105 /DNA_END=2045 /DNA_ORIENTATION=+
MNHDEDKAPPKWWKKYVPNVAVYLPKFVCVHNQRLGLLNQVLTILCVVFTLYYFLSNDKYLITKEPNIQVSICGVQCKPAFSDIDAIADGARTASYCGSRAQAWKQGKEPTQCVGRCGSSFGGASCLSPSDFVQNSAQSVFVPTFYSETINVAPVNGSCPTGTAPQAGRCMSRANYYVAGADQHRVVFNHEFVVTPHKTSLSMLMKISDLKSHSGSFNSQGWEKGMITILVGTDGEEITRFQQSQAVDLSVAELLSAAFYEEQDETAATKKPALDMDVKYERQNRDVAADTRLRNTGMKITIDLFTTPGGKCPVYDKFRDKIEDVSVESGRPITCLFVHADRSWTVRETSQAVGRNGIRTRMTSGVDISFRKMGRFVFLDEQQIIANLTVFFVWIQAPLVMTYWFCVMALGVLSEIYSRVIHDELNVPGACRGVFARLSCHSSAYYDLQDKEHGMSKKRIQDRFADYLADNEDIDDEELQRFVEFVFEGLKSTGHHPSSDKDHVSVQEFAEVCASNESLKFKTLTKLFDADRKMNPLEAFFIDSEIMDMHSGQQDVNVNDLRPGASHSWLTAACADVQALITNLIDSEGKALKTAKDMEVNEDLLALLGDEDIPGKDTGFSAPPKPEQRESFISIEDEECPGREKL